MARSKSVGQGIVHNSGWHVPRWAYWAFGTLAGAVILYEAVAGATALPANPFSIGRNAQPTPPAASTPFTQQTPAVSQYQREALEQIAVIGQKEPGLAELLGQEAWTTDDRQLQAYGLKQLKKFSSVVSEGSYTLDSLVSGTSTTTMLALSKDEFRRATGLQIIKTSIPIIAEFLGVNYQRRLLVINVDAADSSNSPGGINISTIEWQLRAFTHETGHEVYNPDKEANPSPWLEEGAAELAGIYAASKLPETMPELASLMESPEWKGKDKRIMSLEAVYQGALTPLPGEDPNQPLKLGPMPKGFVFLYEFRQLVGQEAFAEAMGHLYDFKAVKAVTGVKDSKGHIYVTDNEVESILEQHVPPAQLPQFKQLYQSRVYGVRETKP